MCGICNPAPWNISRVRIVWVLLGERIETGHSSAGPALKPFDEDELSLREKLLLC